MLDRVKTPDPYLMIAKNLLRSVEGFSDKILTFEGELSQMKATLENEVYLHPAQANRIRSAVQSKVRDLNRDDAAYRENARKTFSSIWEGVKSVFQVATYREIPRIHFESALGYIQNWQPTEKPNQLKEVS
jgi:hypothetical protein